jgi:uncharacterized protein with LGFP repeats
MGDKPSVVRALTWKLRALLVVLVVAAAGVVGISGAAPASALSGSSFDPGFIISDANFFNAAAMTQAQIQVFLDAECPTHNCIDSIKSATTTETSNTECSGGYTGLASETTAAIIYKVQKLCGISAKVLLVTLQKEQGLITKQNPSTGALRAAMGYGCPDTAPCSTSDLGFFRQIYDAAWQFQEYRLTASGSTRYPIGATSPVLYSPNAACGSRSVKIENAATRGLYIYTPYTPNAAALANLTGVGNSCSSYGNRNFWVYYNDWFGAPAAGAGTQSISNAYDASGDAAGPLGAIGTPAVCGSTATVCSQTYANGIIYWTALTGAWAVYGVYYQTYMADGGANGVLGVPTSNPTAVTDPNGNGGDQIYTGGVIHTSAAGTFVVLGAIMTEFSAQGWIRGALGWPTANQVCTSVGCSQAFAGGGIYKTTNGKAYTVSGSAIVTELAAKGGIAKLGYPTSELTTITDPNGNGTTQNFVNGTIHSDAVGTFLVSGPIMTEFSKMGWVRGDLGWPTAEETCASTGVCSQTFQHGTIYQAKSTSAAFSVASGAIATEFAARGGVASLGYPTTDPVAVTDPNGNGTDQRFVGGMIHSSAAGTFLVSGAMLTEYSALGWIRGSLGWPASEQTCTSTGCAQTFQNGTIEAPTTGAPYVVPAVTNPAIKTYWTAHGGATGSLGNPTTVTATVTDPNGNGFDQRFASGMVHSSSAGTFLVTTSVLTEYSKVGWIRGAFGWPTADEVCTASGCTQAFQHGTITVPKVGAASATLAITSAAIKTYWTAHGGATGPLGEPTTLTVTVTDPNGNGFDQRFASGMVHSSAAGTFLVATPVLTEYSKAGWIRGALGWPTADEVCTKTGCTQKFQHGTITAPTTGAASYAID